MPQNIAVPRLHHHSKIGLSRRIPAIFDAKDLLHSLAKSHPQRPLVALMTGVTFHFYDSFSQAPVPSFVRRQVPRSTPHPGK